MTRKPPRHILIALRAVIDLLRSDPPARVADGSLLPSCTTAPYHRHSDTLARLRSQSRNAPPGFA